MSTGTVTLGLHEYDDLSRYRSEVYQLREELQEAKAEIAKLKAPQDIEEHLPRMKEQIERIATYETQLRATQKLLTETAAANLALKNTIYAATRAHGREELDSVHFCKLRDRIMAACEAEDSK